MNQPLIAKRLAEGRQKILSQAKPPPQHMGDFMAHMANHGAVGFIQRLFTGGAQHGIHLRHANRHHTSTCPMGTGVPPSANI